MEERPETTHGNAQDPHFAISEPAGGHNNLVLQPVGHRPVQIITKRGVNCYAVQVRDTFSRQGDKTTPGKIRCPISPPRQKDQQPSAVFTWLLEIPFGNQRFLRIRLWNPSLTQSFQDPDTRSANGQMKRWSQRYLGGSKFEAPTQKIRAPGHDSDFPFCNSCNSFPLSADFRSRPPGSGF